MVTNGVIVVSTLVGFDIILSLVKEKIPVLDRATEGLPVVIVQDGEVLQDRLKKARVSQEDILAAGREAHGLERMDQIKYAVLEQSGAIGVIPVR